MESDGPIFNQVDQFEQVDNSGRNRILFIAGEIGHKVIEFLHGSSAIDRRNNILNKHIAIPINENFSDNASGADVSVEKIIRPTLKKIPKP